MPSLAGTTRPRRPRPRSTRCGTDSSSTKSMIGHTLGAAGAIEAAVCVLTMRDGCMPPTINQEVHDPACDLDYVPNAARKRDVRVTLSNSMGFGGHNAVLILRRWDA